MLHVGAKPANGDFHGLVLVQPDFAGQLEQFQRVFQAQAFHHLAFLEAGETRFGVAFHLADLYERAEPAQPHTHRLAGAGVVAQHPRTAHRRTLDFLRILHFLVEAAVELLQHILPHHASVGNLVKILLDGGRERKIHHVLEMLHQEIGHDHGHVGGEQLGFFGPEHFLLGFSGNAVVLECQFLVGAFLAVAVFANHVAALLHRRNRRRVSGWPPDAEFLQPFHQTGLRVAGRRAGVALHGL